MAGYLDDLMNPANQGALSLSANLLKAGGPSPYPVPFGSALGNAFSGFQGDQQRQAMLGLEQAKMGMLQQQLKQAQAQFEMQQGILRNAGLIPGPGGAPTQPPTQVADASAQVPSYGQPGFQPGPTQAQAPQSQAFPFNLQQLTAMKLAGMPDLLPNYKETKPEIKIEGGILRDMNRGGAIVGTQPIITPNGQAILPNVGPNGSFSVSGVPGGNSVYRNNQNIAAEASARFQ